MKRLGRIAAATLLLLVLGALEPRPGRTTGESPSANATARPTDEHEHQVNPPIPFDLHSDGATGDHRDKTENSKRIDDGTARWWCLQTSLVWAAWVGAVGAICIGILSVWVLKRSLDAAQASSDAATKATEAQIKSAEAATASAKVAMQTLSADRPYLLVTGCTFRGWELADPHPDQTVHGGNAWWHVQFDVQNCGTAPAIVTDIVLHLDAVDDGAFPKPREYGLCMPAADWHPPKVLPATHPWHFKTDKPDGGGIRGNRSEVERGNRQVIAYGQIKYRDFLERTFETGFLWIFHPPGLARLDVTRWSQSYMYPGPKEHHYNT